MFKSFKSFAPALLLLLFSLSFALVASLHADENSKQLAVLYPLQNNFLQNVEMAAHAGIPIIREGAINSILIVTNKSSHTKELLYDNGALLVFDPNILGNCLPKTRLK